jgi:branched-chain amino acid transport system permease protein
MIVQDRFAQADPVYWDFWIGLLIIIIVIFARRGLLGLAEQLLQKARRKP